MAVWPQQIPLFHAGNPAKIIASGTRIRPIPAYIKGCCDDEQERGTGIEQGEIDDRAIDPFAAG
jgi:hypothetical protein